MGKVLFCFLSMFFVFLSHESFGKEEKQKKEEKRELHLGVIWDKDYSPHVGAELVGSLLDGMEFLIPHKTKGDSGLSYAMRAGHSFLDLFLSYHGVLIQHEVFGHGHRLREMKAGNISYGFGLFHGWADGDRTLYNQREAAFFAGGIEAADIMAHRLEMSFLDTESIKTHRAWTYFFAFGNQSAYIHLFPESMKGHDIQSYRRNLNAYYADSNAVSSGRMKLLGLLDYFNPFLYYSVYAIGRYIATGDNSFRYPMFKLARGFEYLPAFRLVMAPYGPEVHFLNYLRIHGFSGLVKLGYGDTLGNQSLFFSAQLNPVQVHKRVSLGGDFSFWSQPKSTFKNLPEAGKRSLGILLALKSQIELVKNFFIQGHLGFKTAGFVPSEGIQGGVIGRAGVRYSF